LSGLGAVLLLMLRSLSYGQGLQASSTTLLTMLPQLEMLDTALERYESQAASGGATVVDLVAPIEFRDVGFSYVEGRPALEEISLRIEPGEVVGVIGPSGAGKSTLVQLLLGVRDPDVGQITVAGVPMGQVDRVSWTRQVSFVAQDPMLFTGTVAENLRFFRDDLSDDQLVVAARQANVLADIEALPDGFGTHLGERGGRLSGGQRQRLAIARALAGGPGLLVLDEPTSALDARSESLIRQTLSDLRGDVTTVVIAHRMSTLEMCDRIMVIEAGRVMAFDEPAALRARSEFYRQALAFSGIA
jgi:ATP-binding cassette, subfamily B, bacterial